MRPRLSYRFSPCGDTGFSIRMKSTEGSSTGCVCVGGGGGGFPTGEVVIVGPDPALFGAPHLVEDHAHDGARGRLGAPLAPHVIKAEDRLVIVRSEEHTSELQSR